MRVCPANPAHATFITTAVEYHDWLVDGNGDFLDDLGGFESRTVDGEYVCRTCHTAAIEKTSSQPKETLE